MQERINSEKMIPGLRKLAQLEMKIRNPNTDINGLPGPVDPRLEPIPSTIRKPVFVR